MDPDFPGCQFFDDPDAPAPAAPAQDEPWHFNPFLPQPPNLNLDPFNLPPDLKPKGDPQNPLLQPLPLPFGPDSDPPEPPSLFPDDGQIPLPGIGPLHPFLKPFDDDPDPRQQREPFTGPT